MCTFLCSVFGEKTFEELKHSYERASLVNKCFRGETMHLHCTEERLVAALQAAGFVRRFSDMRLIREQYPTVDDLVRSIKGMGAQNASERRNRGLGIRTVWSTMITLYEHEFGLPGGIPATYQVIMGGGLKPPEACAP